MENNCHNNDNNNNNNPKTPKPFEKYSFFLDNKNSSQTNTLLRQKISQLGGKIDLFITKDTNCVVTSRPKNEWFCSNIETDSPTPKIISNNAFSRGKLLLEKTNQTFKTLDTLELARNLNIRILRASKVLAFCENFENKPKQSSSNSNAAFRKLNSPFIKVVDNSSKYKPNYKELIEWPELNFEYQPELCPFFKARKVEINNNQSQQVANGFSQSKESTTTNHKQLNEKCTRLTTPILTGTNTNTNTPIINANKSVTTINNNIKNIIKKKHMSHCEICHKDYSDFEKHLIDEVHAEFLSNQENFSELIGVINSLPLFKVPTKKSPSSNEKNFTNLTNLPSIYDNLQPSTTTDNNSKSFTRKATMGAVHSINAWNSAANRSFVAIHNLIKQDENSFES